jgi:hypothetical protein
MRQKVSPKTNLFFLLQIFLAIKNTCNKCMALWNYDEINKILHIDSINVSLSYNLTPSYSTKIRIIHSDEESAFKSELKIF